MVEEWVGHCSCPNGSTTLPATSTLQVYASSMTADVMS
jgi:hypothetical protein